MGKTTLSREYALRYGKAGRYAGVWWIPAESRNQIVLAYDQLARHDHTDIEPADTVEETAQRVKEWLSAQRADHPWLLIYDNATTPDQVRDLLPTGSARCLITSRYQGFDPIAEVKILDKWDVNTTADFLIDRSGREDKSGAILLAEELDGFLLAAEQAAAFLQNMPGFTFDDYRARLSELLDERHEDAKGAYPDTVYATFSAALEEVRKRPEGEAGEAILNICAFLSSEGVPIGLLFEAASEDASFLEPPRTALLDPLRRGRAIRALSAWSLIQVQSLSVQMAVGNVNEEFLVFHRLLAEITRQRLGEDGRTKWGGAAVRIIARFSENAAQPVRWPVMTLLLRHAEPLYRYVPRTFPEFSALSSVLCSFSEFLEAMGSFGGALDLSKKAVSLLPNYPQVYAHELAAVLQHYGNCLRLIGNNVQAEETLKEVLKLRKLYGVNRVEYATALSNISGVYMAQHRFAEGERALLESLPIFEEIDALSSDMGLVLNKLGILHDDWAEQSGQENQRTKSLPYKERALQVSLHADGPRHPLTASRYHALGILRYRMKDLSRAAADQVRAAAILLSLGLVNHPYTKEVLRHLVRCWWALGWTDKIMRISSEDYSDVLPTIEQIEQEQRDWVADDPQNRFFGPAPHRPAMG